MAETQKRSPLFFIQPIIILVLLGLLVAQYSGVGKGGEIMPKEKVAEETMAFIKENLAPQLDFNYQGVEEESGFYKISFSIAGTEDSPEQEDIVYVSKDGKYLFFQPINMKEAEELETTPEPTNGNEPVSNIDPEEMKTFIDCLKNKGLVVYGANWCGWTKQIIATLGGQELIAPIYVECTEQEALCKEKRITGYPTILINGEEYQGSRTVVEFANKTGCTAPAGAGNVPENSAQGEC